MFKGKTVLITGGTGSFGRWALREILKTEVEEVRILSRDEEKQLTLKREVRDSRLKFLIGNVRDYVRTVDACMGADIVYHAAAQKIIDSCESNPTEALKTNVLGSLNVKRACEAVGVETAILISTDKAVKPINFYGMTKSIAERIWIDGPSESSKKFIVIRYGNVVGSRGSVVPYFKQLIDEGKPLPITHFDMTRFLITLKQAIALVFYATKHGKHSRIYVPDLPACKIVDLAKVLGGDSYPLRLIGLRLGEKIHECLIQEYEIHKTEKKDGYFVIHSGLQSNYQFLTKEYTSDKVKQLNKAGILALLKESEMSQ